MPIRLTSPGRHHNSTEEQAIWRGHRARPRHTIAVEDRSRHSHSPVWPLSPQRIPPRTMTIATASERVRTRLHDRLARETRGEVHLRPRPPLALRHRRQPLPDRAARRGRAADVADVVQAVQIAAEEGVPVLPRGAATSLSGQTVGPAIILDFSKYLNRIGVVDRDRMTVRVEPGVVLDRLNAHLKPLGLMFGPDVSTSDRATIGGMIGNNSAGARSLRYGKTVDHVRVARRRPRRRHRARPSGRSRRGAGRDLRRTDRVGPVHREVRDTVDRHREAIAAQFPRILRRVSGYNLDEFVPGLPVRAAGWVDDPWRFNLARLIVGSEGTLAVDRRRPSSRSCRSRRRTAWSSSRSPRSRRRSTAWPRSSRPARWPSRCSTG